MIRSFTGKYAFLSNFHPSPFIVSGRKWPTVEHFFQAMKSESPEEREEIRRASSPSKAKRIGRKVKLRKNWNSLKTTYMRFAIREKFKQNAHLAQKLLETGDIGIIEGNTWHDNFWGDCTCPKCKSITGQNNLGRMLVTIRHELRSST